MCVGSSDTIAPTVDTSKQDLEQTKQAFTDAGNVRIFILGGSYIYHHDTHLWYVDPAVSAAAAGSTPAAAVDPQTARGRTPAVASIFI